MRRRKRGTLRSGKGGKGGKVTSRKQAIAIALSEARKKGKKVPPTPPAPRLVGPVGRRPALAPHRRRQHNAPAMTRVLIGVTLIDGTGAAPVPDAAVVIDDDRIAAVGPRPSMTWPADAEIVNVEGRTVIPGLIDAHDHLASHGYALATRWGLDEAASTAHMRTGRVLAETLAMGYTTVRDGGGLDAGFKARCRAGADPGTAPRARHTDHLADRRHR